MEIETSEQDIWTEGSDRVLSGAPSRARAKSSLRLKYEAETMVIERKIGSLDSIRQQLGLSQRKIAQLLLVDPSAWTRWTKGEDKAPPHIYRMLQWYLALEEKYPVLDVNFWLNTVSQVSDREQLFAQNQSVVSATSLAISRLEAKLLEQKIETRKREHVLRRWVLLSIGASSLLGVAIGLLVSFSVR